MTSSPGERHWRVLVWLLLLLVVVSWPIRYAQHVAFGQVVLFTGILRLLLFVLIFACALWTASYETWRSQARIIAIGYLLSSLLIYNLIVVNFGIFYAGFAFNFFVVPPAIAAILFANAGYFHLRDPESERRVIHLMLSVAVPVACFGVLQFVLDDPVLHSGFSGVPGEFGTAGQATIRLTELAATHRIRANSIFGSAIDFGHFATLFAILCGAMAWRSRARTQFALVYTLLAALFVAAVLSTNTRNMLLFLGCSALGCLLIQAGLSLRALVVASLGIVGLLYATVYTIVALAPGWFAGFFDPVSLLQRAAGVYVTVNQFIVNADTLTHVLFGFGYMQSADFPFLPTTIFDSTELDIYLYAGVLGVVLYAVLLLGLFIVSVRQWRRTGRSAWLAAASLLFGTPLFSTMNIDVDQPCFLFAFALLVGGGEHRACDSPVQCAVGNLSPSARARRDLGVHHAAFGNRMSIGRSTA